MNSDVVTLQSIANTLESRPLANQRELAKNAGMSVGLMNTILKRFAERGWIMLSNVNLRKLSYALTPAGIAELKSRSSKFARRTFELANVYNEKICALVSDAKSNGKKSLVLYGKSYIKFLVSYACQTAGLEFEEKETFESVLEDSLCIVGELNDESEIARLEKSGCVNLLEFLKE